MKTRSADSCRPQRAQLPSPSPSPSPIPHISPTLTYTHTPIVSLQITLPAWVAAEDVRYSPSCKRYPPPTASSRISRQRERRAEGDEGCHRGCGWNGGRLLLEYGVGWKVWGAPREGWREGIMRKEYHGYDFHVGGQSGRCERAVHHYLTCYGDWGGSCCMDGSCGGPCGCTRVDSIIYIQSQTTGFHLLHFAHDYSVGSGIFLGANASDRGYHDQCQKKKQKS